MPRDEIKSGRVKRIAEHMCSLGAYTHAEEILALCAERDALREQNDVLAQSVKRLLHEISRRGDNNAE
jgi:hypothetical protein